jgi:8-oxo-dGTP pyrophosphatase MutT (NUDIX family)
MVGLLFSMPVANMKGAIMRKRRQSTCLPTMCSGRRHNSRMDPTDWLEGLERLAQRAPQVEREPLCIDDFDCGSIEPALAQRLRAAGLPLRRDGLRWVLDGGNEGLAVVAEWLHSQRLGGRWRDELMPVVDTHGVPRALVERAAVRPLGIATHAVHLVGCAGAHSVWIQQRAFDKATDPGRWDTLMGGLMAGSETVMQTLARETWEEAGLKVEDLLDLAPIGCLTVRRPVPDGYMVEHIHMFEARVPEGRAPLNQDGEVERFDCVEVPALIDRIKAGAFTLEAALIHARWLKKRSGGWTTIESDMCH